jgi:hypothetical protein
LRFPSACSSPDGHVAVAWTAYYFGLNFHRVTSWQQYAPDGSPQDGGQTPFDDQSFDELDPAVACRPDGSYVLVDEKVMPCSPLPGRTCGADGSGDGVFFAGGVQVNSSTPGNQRAPAIAADGNGNTLVIWTSDTQDGGHPGIFGQRFSSTGTPLGSEFQLNANAGGTQSAPAVSCVAAGHCVAAWNAPDGSETGVFAKRVPDIAN